MNSDRAASVAELNNTFNAALSLLASRLPLPPIRVLELFPGASLYNLSFSDCFAVMGRDLFWWYRPNRPDLIIQCHRCNHSTAVPRGTNSSNFLTGMGSQEFGGSSAVATQPLRAKARPTSLPPPPVFLPLSTTLCGFCRYPSVSPLLSYFNMTSKSTAWCSLSSTLPSLVFLYLHWCVVSSPALLCQIGWFPAYPVPSGVAMEREGTLDPPTVEVVDFYGEVPHRPRLPPFSVPPHFSMCSILR